MTAGPQLSLAAAREAAGRRTRLLGLELAGWAGAALGWAAAACWAGKGRRAEIGKGKG
jgi:hypothetical protein